MGIVVILLVLLIPVAALIYVNKLPKTGMNRNIEVPWYAVLEVLFIGFLLYAYFSPMTAPGTDTLNLGLIVDRLVNVIVACAGVIFCACMRRVK
jgi:hypothetical protein